MQTNLLSSFLYILFSGLQENFGRGAHVPFPPISRLRAGFLFPVLLWMVVEYRVSLLFIALWRTGYTHSPFLRKITCTSVENQFFPLAITRYVPFVLFLFYFQWGCPLISFWFNSILRREKKLQQRDQHKDKSPWGTRIRIWGTREWGWLGVINRTLGDVQNRHPIWLRNQIYLANQRQNVRNDILPLRSIT